MSRRDFILYAGYMAWAASGLTAGTLGLLQKGDKSQTPEQTPEADPYAETDAANIEALTAIDRRQQEQVVLQSPRILGYLEYREDVSFAPDRDRVRAVLADGQGQVYGFMGNVECTFEIAKPYLGDRMELQRTDDEFNVFYYPVDESEELPYGLRVDGTSGRVLDDIILPLSEGGEVMAPYYALDEITHNGQTMQCPDLGDQARDHLQGAWEETGDIIDRIENWWNNR